VSCCVRARSDSRLPLTPASAEAKTQNFAFTPADVRYLAAADGLINSMAKFHALGEDADDAMATALVVDRGQTFTGVLNTLSELLLVAPEDIILLADNAATIFGGMKT
jgi:hypothetical protein